MISMWDMLIQASLFRFKLSKPARADAFACNELGRVLASGLSRSRESAHWKQVEIYAPKGSLICD